MRLQANRFAKPFILLALLLAGAVASAQVVPSTYPMGANVVRSGEGTGVVFRVWAPNAQFVNVPGQFNAWANTGASLMTKDEATGIWSLHVANATVGQEYKYYVRSADFTNDGQRYKVDPWSRDTINTTGNSIIRGDGSTYNWLATDWQTPDRDNMVVYELHIGTFSGNGDGVGAYPARFRDVVDRHVEDIKAVGANMVEIMPVHEFPATSWGYNPVNFFAPESDYGSPDDLRYMVDTFHQNGIGVIVDVVYNHVSSSDNNLWNYDGNQNIYFFGDNCQGQTPWGATRPKYTEQQVRSLLIENARYWIEEFRMDGIRVDATSFMRGYCNEMGEGWLTMGDVADAVHAANPRAIAIAEELPNNDAVTRPRNQGGAGYDAQWDGRFFHAIRDAFGAMQSGGLPNIGDIAGAIEGNGFGGPNTAALKYAESHDEAGNGDRLTLVIDPANGFSAKAIALNKVAGGISLLAPGVPMIFMGQEFMEDKRFGDGSGDRIWWGFLNTYSGVRDFFGDVARLRTSRGSLRASSGVQITHQNGGAGVVAFQRYNNSGDVTFVVANFGATSFSTYSLGVPQAGTWHELVNSQLAAYNGAGATSNGARTANAENYDGQPAKLDVALPAQSFLVFSQTPIEQPNTASHGLMAR